MNFLLDTNIIIPLEPATAADVEPASTEAMRLFKTAQEVGAGLFIHPQQSRDIQNDADESRRSLRVLLFQKYRQLPSPPPLTDHVREAANFPETASHTWIDAHLVAALDGKAVHYLISEVRGLHRVCRRLGLDDRCLTLAAALDLLDGERTVVPLAPPAVLSVHAHQLNSADPIFDQVRADYPPFDEWLDKCKREHRQAWTVQLPGMKHLAGVAIVNPEDREWSDARNPTLKICTFKISESATGGKLGELLLRAIFENGSAGNRGLRRTFDRPQSRVRGSKAGHARSQPNVQQHDLGQELGGVPELAAAVPTEFLAAIWPRFLQLLEPLRANAPSEMHVYAHESAWFLEEGSSALLPALEDALSALAQRDEAGFWSWIAGQEIRWGVLDPFGQEWPHLPRTLKKRVFGR